MKVFGPRWLIPAGPPVCCLLLAIAAGSTGASQVKTKIENGVQVVYNPKTPAPPPGAPTVLAVKEEMSLGGAGEAEEAMVLEPRDVEVDSAGNIYVLDRKTVDIKVFDRSGKFLQTIGKKGQGPGEFEMISDIEISPQGGIIACDPSSRRIQVFGPDGRVSGELSARTMWMLNRIRADSLGNIVGRHTIMDKEPRTEIVKFNSKLERLITIATVPIARYPEFNPYFPLLFFEIAGEDRILWGKTTEYEFQVVSSEGKVIRRIIKDYEPVKLTQKDRDEKSKALWGGSNPTDVRVTWPDNFPAFQDFVMDDRGWLFVRPYARVEEGKGNPYDVFDAEGRYAARVFFPAQARALKAEKLYTIEEDAEGNLLVKRYGLEWK